MSNPWSRKAKKTPSLKGLAKTNGKAPVKPSLASLTKGEPTKPSLRSLVTTEPAPVERPYQAPKPKVKEDFRHGGVLFSGAEVQGEITAGHRDGIFRPYGSVDVTNGDLTFTFHNRYGSWMHDVWNSDQMAEPARVLEWLGIDMHHVDLQRAMTKRFEAELKKQKILTPHQQRAKLDADAAEARKKPKPPPKETTKMSSGKITLKGLKK